ncbi:MAG: hypothetical protein Q8K43_02190 [Sulfurimicrobium sp.]|jgi:hypothetical protein|nr:hypothetical protein [Sulfurimicrobium sp.]MDO9190702.1 hypothetical protein [Sulfurimicrobium sp.]MDP1705312.1 hypothetical protein [Sulfurimicrobium sp.]MDP1896675.1 hypothetical protein [Sulfurimicrobium sp.]MDP2199828.1 hypothetical protein [Sulfurimicrobium sp.]
MEMLKLLLSPEQAETQCQVLVTQTRHSGQTLAALTALHAFINATARPDEQTSSIHNDIQRILEQHIAAARQSVMQDNLVRLLDALGAQNICGIQSVHTALSRNGFHQTVLSAIRQLPEAKLRAAADWAADWQCDARTRATAASPYPDALDLRGAGISVADFAAMSELNMYFQEALA